MRKPTRRTALALICGALLLAGSASLAKEPARNVSHARHPNLSAAQKYCRLAHKRLVAAQKANEFDMGGHAQKAKALLEQASAEIKLAAGTANKMPDKK